MKEKSGLVLSHLSFFIRSLSRSSRFGKHILSKLIETVCQYVPEKDTASVLDIGTGNGHVIQRLSRRGFVHLTGIDYSEKSIQLAREQLGPTVRLDVVDITASDDVSTSLGQFDVAIDKGTLDAILLCSPDERPDKRRAYVQTVHRHVKDLLFLVSCNWTRTELMEFLHPSKDTRLSLGRSRSVSSRLHSRTRNRNADDVVRRSTRQNSDISRLETNTL